MHQSVFKNKFVLILLALLAFAGNSILCRVALNNGHIDPTSFTSVRLLSGALFLIVILFPRQKFKLTFQPKHSISASALFIYAAAFSYAYQYLETGTGALILFAAVQITMVLYSIVIGNKPKMAENVGMSLAFIGLVVLVSPTLATPGFIGAVLMTISGIAWATYTIMGKGSLTPTLDNRRNFVLTIPLCIVIFIFNQATIEFDSIGLALAIASGALASGAGYAIWYAALKHIDVMQAGILQLSVPLIAAVGGVIWAHEPITLHFLIAAALIIFGIYIILTKPKLLQKQR